MLLVFCHKREIEEIEEPDPFIYKRGFIQKGETLAKALKDQGLDNVTVYKLVNKLDTIYNLRRSQPADSFVVKLDTLNIIHELRYMPDRIHTYRVIIDTLQNYFTRIDTLNTRIRYKTIEGEISSSLWQAVLDAKGNPGLAMSFTQIFQWDIDFFIDPQKGDKFSILYEEIVNENGDYIKDASILAANYSTRGYDKTAYRFTSSNGLTRYYDDSGKSFQKAFLKSPLNYKRISSYFGRRVHPVTRKVSQHNGVDYAAAHGTPVEATADGVVTYAAWHPNHTGNTVKIRHANGYETLYGHLSKFGRFKVGHRIKQHDIIGYVGSTGRSTGSHLHYTIYLHGKPINPLSLKNVSGPPLPTNEKAEFSVIVDRLNRLMADPDTVFPDSIDAEKK
jgi:murein DD-endopeptidase MepM/ murein hydrolase activator NlpD